MVPNYTVNKATVPGLIRATPDVNHEQNNSSTNRSEPKGMGPVNPSSEIAFSLKFKDEIDTVSAANDTGQKSQTHRSSEYKFGAETHRSNASETGRASHASVFYDKSPLGHADAGQIHSVPSLGFTWSLSTDKRERVKPENRPTPDSILDKLGRLKVWHIL